MSHFTVIVIGENVEDQLEPYAEQEFQEQYGAFVDVEEEHKNEYENEVVKILKYSDGTLAPAYSTNPEKTVVDSVDGSYKDLYATFEEYMSEYAGYPERDPSTGKYGYMHNPNAKWDWYQEGGRWSGFFKLKPDSMHRYSNVTEDGYVDSILLSDWDLEGALLAVKERRNQEYDAFESVVKGRSIPNWSDALKACDNDPQKARAFYNGLEVVKDLYKAGIYSFMADYNEAYGPNREAFLTRSLQACLVPFAVVKDSIWYEQGKMGWFGISVDNQTEAEWQKQFWTIINSLPRDTRLTMIDCHI